MKTIKLYSPFRAGSNLVKAGIEFNCPRLQVLNTGDNHWKHAFFAKYRKYDAYIFCVRHPIDLACAIRRYFFKNGRNISTNAEWDSFFETSISIFDQTSKTTRSPILYPNILDLINAWYFNYSETLKRKNIKSSLIAYENLITNQQKEICEALKTISMARHLKDDFKSITGKTRNMGDERYTESSSKVKNFSKRIIKQRAACDFASDKINIQLSDSQKESINSKINWFTTKVIGY